MLILPVLIALGPVTRIQDRVTAGVIEARFVTANLSLLGEHPVLEREIIIRLTTVIWIKV